MSVLRSTFEREDPKGQNSSTNVSGGKTSYATATFTMRSRRRKTPSPSIGQTATNSGVDLLIVSITSKLHGNFRAPSVFDNY